jgi:hypothetical protein
MAQVIPALKTMVAIHEKMTADQGAAFRLLEKEMFLKLDDAFRGEQEGHRGHLGASVLGDGCGRAIWYSFRWATKPHFDAQTLRLFNRGHLEEARFMAMLKLIGIEVVQYDQNGKQYRINFASGHGGGSGDGFGRYIPDLNPDIWVLLEFKTHNDKSFSDLAGENFKDWFEFVSGQSRTPAPFKGKGVRESKPDHFFQIQTYMHKFNLPCTLYGAVNKNNDCVWFELVMYDKAVAEQLVDRAEKIIWMQEPPKKINEAIGYYGCRYCGHKPVCKMGATPDRNCRTCKFSEPVMSSENDGHWNCRFHRQLIPKELQPVGCAQYDKKAM